jgi:hypothetical protein
MEQRVENSALIGRVAEAHELVERLKAEIFVEEERKMTSRVVHKLLFYFLVTLMVGSISGMFYMNWQTDKRLSMAKKTGILTLSDGSMFELAPLTPKAGVVTVVNIK